MYYIPTCMVGGSDDKDIPLIKEELEKILIKDVVDKFIKKEGYYLVYFKPIMERIDLRITRFIHNITKNYLILHFITDDMKNYTYIKKAPYKLLSENQGFPNLSLSEN